MNTIEFPALMRKLSIALEELKPDQINNILNDTAHLKITVITNRPSSPVAVGSLNIESYVSQLNTLNNRQAGKALLDGVNKPVLLALAKQLDLSVNKSIPKEKLLDRIVERAIGLRLRQQAFVQLR